MESYFLKLWGKLGTSIALFLKELKWKIYTWGLERANYEKIFYFSSFGYKWMRISMVSVAKLWHNSQWPVWLKDFHRRWNFHLNSIDEKTSNTIRGRLNSNIHMQFLVEAIFLWDNGEEWSNFYDECIAFYFTKVNIFHCLRVSFSGCWQMIPITEETLLRRMNLKVGSHLSPSFYCLPTARLYKAVTWCLICYMIDVFWHMSRTHLKKQSVITLGRKNNIQFFPKQYTSFIYWIIKPQLKEVEMRLR